MIELFVFLLFFHRYFHLAMVRFHCIASDAKLRSASVQIDFGLFNWLKHLIMRRFKSKIRVCRNAEA